VAGTLDRSQPVDEQAYRIAIWPRAPHLFKKKSIASETKIKLTAKPFAGTSAMAWNTRCKAAQPSVTAVSRQQVAGHLAGRAGRKMTGRDSFSDRDFMIGGMCDVLAIMEIR
jgi:hypothetical protein